MFCIGDTKVFADGGLVTCCPDIIGWEAVLGVGCGRTKLGWGGWTLPATTGGLVGCIGWPYTGLTGGPIQIIADKNTGSHSKVEIGRDLGKLFYAPADWVYAGLGGIALFGCCIPGTAGTGGRIPGCGGLCGRANGVVVPMGGGRWWLLMPFLLYVTERDVESNGLGRHLHTQRNSLEAQMLLSVY